MKSISFSATLPASVSYSLCFLQAFLAVSINQFTLGLPVLFSPFSGMFHMSPAIITSDIGSSGLALIVLPSSVIALFLILSLSFWNGGLGLLIVLLLLLDAVILFSSSMSFSFVFVLSSPSSICPNVVFQSMICLSPFSMRRLYGRTCFVVLVGLPVHTRVSRL